MAKINKNTWLIILLVLLNVLSLGALWFTKAEGPRPGKRDHKERMDKFLKSELGLNDEQLTTFQGLRKEHFEDRKNNYKALREKKRELIKAATALEEDSVLIQSLIDDIVVLERNSEMLFIEHLSRLKAVCTPEQQQNLSKVFLRGMRSHGPPPDRKK
jgi:Spy/CpxP family protein refolding chaperone